ncbi:hypothetical protein SprV_0200871900 [Sparganum proliferum]
MYSSVASGRKGKDSLKELDSKVKPYIVPPSLRKMESQTNFTAKELRILYRGFKNACNSGLATKDSFYKAFDNIFPTAASHSYASLTFKAFDLDGRGSITFSEFACVLSRLLRGSTDEILHWIFDLYDMDKDNYISAAELTTVVKAIYELHTDSHNKVLQANSVEAKVEFILQKFDLDRDGRISRTEFITVCSQVKSSYMFTVQDPVIYIDLFTIMETFVCEYHVRSLVFHSGFYIQEALLGDRTAYIPSEGDLTKTLMNKIKKDLASLRKSKAITQLDWQRKTPKDFATAIFYGLPKIHKPGTPLRPIVSLRGTLAFGLAKWLFQRLKFLTQGSETTVHSAERFIEKLQGIRLTDDEVMVSFVVVSLFTSIQQHLAVKTVQTLLEQHYNETDNKLKIKHLADLLKHCLKTFFTFNGATYEQVKGTPMGSPLSSLIAEAVLQRLEALAFDHYPPRLWVRYVDDTFVIINRDRIGEFTQHLNSIFPDIQFTMEEEKDCQLSFLDVLVQRKEDWGLKTTVYRKATNTSRILSFLSNHPLSHKRSCVRTLYRRVQTHCTEPADKKAEAQFLGNSSP